MTVVVGVDNSASSRAALRLAAQEARWRQVPLVAVTAYEAPLGPVGGYPIAAKQAEGEQRATAEAALRATVDDELGDQAGQADLRISEGLAGRVIIEAAREAKAELIVLAARPGRTVVPGTVSQYVLLKARCPVAVVPVEDPDDKTSGNP
ncbi:MAG: universal stress protein [Streptosporangiaceae bacterium]